MIQSQLFNVTQQKIFPNKNKILFFFKIYFFIMMLFYEVGNKKFQSPFLLFRIKNKYLKYKTAKIFMKKNGWNERKFEKLLPIEIYWSYWFSLNWFPSSNPTNFIKCYLIILISSSQKIFKKRDSFIKLVRVSCLYKNLYK